MKIIGMFSGLPGSGKTTTIDYFQDELSSMGIKVGISQEYPYIEEWANRDENGIFINPLPGNFDIKPEGYYYMNEYVGRKVGAEVGALFEEGSEVVLFETARGVGEPMVRYSDFLQEVYKNMGFTNHLIQITHFEMRSELNLIRERMQKRFDESGGVLPPPRILEKYLTVDGVPRCLAVRDLQDNSDGLPLVINESIVNGQGIEGIVTWVEALTPRITGLIDAEGRFGLSERGMKNERRY